MSTDLVPVAEHVPAVLVLPHPETSRRGVRADDEALIQWFLGSPKQAKNSEATRRDRRCKLRGLGRVLNCGLLDASAEQIGRWMNRGIAEATRVSGMSHFGAFYAWAMSEGLVESSPTEVFRRRGAAGLGLAPTPAAMQMNGPNEVSVALVQVSPSVELYRVTLELGVCEGCGDQDDRLRRLGGVGGPLCPMCYQRGKRAARKAGEALRDASRRTTAADLRSELIARGLGARTVRSYCQAVWNADRWFEERGWALARALPEQIAAYADTKPLTHASRLGLKCALRHYWEICRHPRPPLGAIRVPPEPQGVSKALDDEPAHRLAAAARARGDRPGLAVVIGLYAGLRREELAALPWSAFDVDAGYLTVTGKGSKQRTIPLHPAIVTALATVPRTDDVYVFPGRRAGSPVSVATIWAWVRLVAAEAGLPPVSPHVLRHCALSTANDNTGDLRAVQALAGHAKVETTSGYSRASKRRLEAAVASIDY
jgi:Site-specific recombinase XerD